MKLLHLITGLSAGGAETALCRLLESSPASWHEQAVVALGRESALSSRVRASGATLLHMNIAATRPNPLCLISLRNVLRRERPDLVHGWMYHANLIAWLSVAGRGTPLLWGIRHSLHDLGTEKATTRAAIRLGARVSRLPDVIVYNSEESARQHEAVGYRADRTRVIRNGFDTTTFKPDPQARARIRAELGIGSDAFVIGQVARWHATKDHETLLRAAALYLRVCPKTVFVLVGNGVDAQNHRLTSLVRDLGISSSVRLCGHRTDVASVTAAFDVANLSSGGESFPNVIGEAMACGVPCVATDVGGVREIVRDCGVVVERKNPAQMSAAWLEFEKMGSAARMSIGERGRRRVSQHYSLETCTAAYWTLYEELMGGRFRSNGRDDRTLE